VSRVWQVVRHGSPSDALELGDRSVPEPGPGELVVRTRAVALNFPDVLLCRGEYQVRPELPFPPGIEACGEVVAVGSDAAESGAFAVGDRVVGSRIGTLAEHAVLDAAVSFPAPDALSDAEASGLIIAYQTAYVALHRRAQLQAGETVLVHAAAGGVGTAAVQLAKAAGARVIGVVSSPAKAEVARSCGADEVVDRTSEDVIARVKKLAGRHGVDVVFDPVGGDAFDQSTKVIAFEGRIVVVGFAGGRMQEVKPNHALVKNYSVLGLHWALYNQFRPDLVREAHGELTRLAAEGLIRPVIGEQVGFADAPEALDRLAAGATVGRSVVTVD